MRYEIGSGSPYASHELWHFGIKGQQWGVRRFQNEDRTLTEAGKERYRKTDGEEKKQESESYIEKIRKEKKEQRIGKAVEEIDGKQLSDRFSDDDVEKYSRIGNGRMRKQILEDMAKDPKLDYPTAYGKRCRKNAVGLLVAIAGVTLAALGLKKALKTSDKKASKESNDFIKRYADLSSRRSMEFTSDRYEAPMPRNATMAFLMARDAQRRYAKG